MRAALDAGFAAAVVAVATATAATLVAIDTRPLADMPARLGPSHYRVCYPVDSSDALEDRVEGEQETLDDEGEIGCVGRAEFVLIRQQLGLRGKVAP
jgi:hypothetical protein